MVQTAHLGRENVKVRRIREDIGNRETPPKNGEFILPSGGSHVWSDDAVMILYALIMHDDHDIDQS